MEAFLDLAAGLAVAFLAGDFFLVATAFLDLMIALAFLGAEGVVALAFLATGFLTGVVLALVGVALVGVALGYIEINIYIRIKILQLLP